jgi:Cu-Zn family superoxide dismutase
MNMNFFKPQSLVLLPVSFFLFGCATMSDKNPTMAVAELAPTQGNQAHGTVQFEQKGSKVQVIAHITGLPANSEHGFHVHEKGDCSAPDGTSAGGHFNPMSEPHGHGMHRHVGDMPNLVADANGVANLSVELDLMTLREGSNNIIGRGIIVHASPDDYASQPTGNAGGRIACGVIKAK